MKASKTINKLAINKETVAHLENSQMISVIGGTDRTVCYGVNTRCVCDKTITLNCPITQ